MLLEKRPKYLNLFRIRLPIPGIVSILHRVSGFGLFILLGLLLWVFQVSLSSQEGFEEVSGYFNLWLVKIVLIGVIWAFAHHLIAGIRFLLLDLHVGVELFTARLSSALVLASSAVVTLYFAVVLW